MTTITFPHIDSYFSDNKQMPSIIFSYLLVIAQKKPATTTVYYKLQQHINGCITKGCLDFIFILKSKCVCLLLSFINFLSIKINCSKEHDASY